MAGDAGKDVKEVRDVKEVKDVKEVRDVKEVKDVKETRKRQSYFCNNCDFPSDVFGLLHPCTHVYCLSCASLMSDCVICKERVDSVRVVKDVNSMYVSPLTLQGFIGEEGLRELREQLGGR
jgi:hypothetical protein